MKHTFSSLLFITLLTLGINTFAQTTTLTSKAINYAGKQRMLGQRIAKNKLYIKANKNSKNAKEELKEAVISFELGLDYLKKFTPTRTINHQIEIQEFIYKYYKELAFSDSDSSIQDIINYNTMFLKVCDDGVTSIIEYSKTQKNKKIDKNQKYIINNIAMAIGSAGELRYLTERLNLYYAIHTFGIKKITPKEINAIVNAMDKKLENLTVLEFNTLEIDDSLSQIIFYWEELKKALYKKNTLNLSSREMTPEKLYILCNTILTKADTTTEMYVKLSNF